MEGTPANPSLMCPAKLSPADRRCCEAEYPREEGGQEPVRSVPNSSVKCLLKWHREKTALSIEQRDLRFLAGYSIMGLLTVEGFVSV